MSANPERLQYLFKKYIGNNCNQKELNEFWQLLSELSEEEVVGDELKALWKQQNDGYNPAASADGEKIFARILQKDLDVKSERAQRPAELDELLRQRVDADARGLGRLEQEVERG